MPPTRDEEKLQENKAEDGSFEWVEEKYASTSIWEDINEKTRHVLVMVVENTVEVVAGEMLSLN